MNYRIKSKRIPWHEALIALLLIAALITGFLLWQRGKSKTSTAAAPEKSVAVLPFANLSRDPDNAYFADGIQDEILTRLSKIADLKVISRTSTQHYKSAPENLPEIARALGVAHILEGSVPKSGEKDVRLRPRQKSLTFVTRFGEKVAKPQRLSRLSPERATNDPEDRARPLAVAKEHWTR